MKALEITPENLEDLLAYDDLFLDYFNAFLALPVFPQALAYNRLTGAFEEVPSPFNTAVTDSLGYSSPASSLPYGATEAVRENMLQWAREERLPLFLRTQLFRELKLCKLLLRPLDDRNSASRGSSRQIRGYSRQSESYVSSLSYSGDNSADDELIDEDFNWDELRRAGMFRYRRPGSNAFSDPTLRYLAAHSTTVTTIKNSSSNATATAKFSELRSSGTAERARTGTTKRGTRISSLVEVIPQGKVAKDIDTSSQSKKSRIVPATSSTEAAFLRGTRVLSAPVNYQDYLKMPFFHFETLLREEPAPTGNPYVTFEEECVSEAQTETDVRNMEGRLKMTFQQMKEQVIGTYIGMESFKEFLQDTNGVYLLNFWLDCEFFKDSTEDIDEEEFIEKRNCLFRDIQDKYKLNLTNDAKEQITRAASNVGLTHTIFLRTQYDVLRRLRAYWIARFLTHFERQKPMSEEEEEQMVQFKLKKPPLKNPLPFFPSISLVHSMPAWPDEALNQSKTASWEALTSGSGMRDIMSARSGRRTARFSRSGSTKDRLILALTADRLAGGPLKSYLECCRIRPGRDTPMSTSTEAIEITLTGAEQDILVVKRPRPWVRRLQPLRVPGSTQSERAKRLNKAITEAEDIDDERMAEQKKKNKEKRKEAERERKRAVRAAYARQREAKLKKPPSRKKSGVDDEGLLDKGGKLPTFQEMGSNKQMMQLFKKYLNEVDNKEVTHMTGLYQEIDHYFNIKDGKNRKDTQASHIHKGFFDSQSRKHVVMPEKVVARLSVEKERPRTPTFKDAQKYILGKIEETFKDFLYYQAEELGIDTVEMLSMSTSELVMRMGSDAAMLTSWNKGNKSKGKEDMIKSGEDETSEVSTPTVVTARRRRLKQTGRAQPTKNDMAEFISTLNQSASGQLPIDMLYFYKYLVKHGEEDSMPLLDRDLFFHVEVQKFKDASHAFSDEEMLKRKVQSIIDCFLESVYTPSLQIDIPNDLQQKIIKNTQRYMNGKEINASLFDDAQMLVFKELLPYWAGFRKTYTPPENPEKKPITKYQKMLKKRLENIENYKIPSANLKLPAIPEGAVPSFSLTLADGIKFREAEDGGIVGNGTPMPDKHRVDFARRRFSIAPSIESTRTNRKLSSHHESNKSTIAAR